MREFGRLLVVGFVLPKTGLVNFGPNLDIDTLDVSFRVDDIYVVDHGNGTRNTLVGV
jgi:hypothetical protein